MIPLTDSRTASRIAEETARELYRDLQRKSPRGEILIPSAGPYRSVFAWDTGWNYFWLKALDPKAARAQLLTLFRYQEEDGRISHEVMLEPRSAYRGIRRLQLYMLRHSFVDDSRSYFIDPPVYLWAALDAIYESQSEAKREENSFLLEAVLKKLEWIDRNRCLSELPYPFSHLPLLFHPLESGTDHASSFDAAYGGGLALYLDTFHLPRRLKKLNWELPALKHEELLFFDLTYLGFYLLSLRLLRFLKHAANRSRMLNGQALSALERWNDKSDLEDAFISRFFDSEAYAFRSFHCKRGRLKGGEVNPTFSSMIPLLLPSLDGSIRRQAIERHLLPGKTFYHGRIPDYNPKGADQAFLHKKLWRGSCSWMNMNYIHYRLLDLFAYREDAELLARKLPACVQQAGAREFYHSHSLSGGGCRGFSWNGLTLAMQRESRRSDDILSALFR